MTDRRRTSLAARIGMVAALVGALVGAGTLIAWSTDFGKDAIDHFEQVAANTQSIALGRFEILAATKKKRRLTREEWIAYCQYGKQLKIFGPGNPCPPR